MIRRPPRSTRTDTLFPYTTLFRSRSFCVCGGPEQRPVTWLRLLPYPLAIAVTKSRRSEQALDEAVVVELDAVRRGHARQARHGHDLAADRHHEAGTGRQAHLADRHLVSFRRAAQVARKSTRLNSSH